MALFIRFLPYIIAALGAASLVGAIYWKGQTDAKQVYKIDQLQETIKDEEKLNEIRNHRPDDDTLIDILRSGSF